MKRRIVENKDTMEIISCVILFGSIILIFRGIFTLTGIASHTIYLFLLPFLGFLLGLFFLLVTDLLSRRMPNTKIVLEDFILWYGWWRLLNQENDETTQTNSIRC
ncbi:MAG: hypothetical protein ACFFCX_01610 [Candidatus Sifarchaeia archaeon]